MYVPCTQKLFNLHEKTCMTDSEISIISTILERYFTEMFYYCFIETSFAVHLQFFGGTIGTCIHFSVMLLFKCSTRLDRLKFVFFL